ncbi:DUF3558 family protein [Corynebacterium lizhenjunii]|uniref:DUF3558 family protein n=1 Tax=Corynebacterium lizhenjunii TaxID=2709394 RepID=A0A7T0KE13_9CORY|nr:DUF3558 family protein [Corynebacterium lizhenjunii]
MAASVLGLTGCATTPPQIPDHPPVPTHASEHVSETAPDNAEAAEFAMPTPGPFDPNVPGFKPFKPCEEIPDMALAAIGVQKKGAGSSYEPFGCPIEAKSLLPSGTIELVDYPYSIRQLVDHNIFELADEPGARIDRSAVLIAPEVFTGGYCLSGVETPRGFLGVEYTQWLNQSSGSSLCEVPTQIIQTLYQEESYAH